MKTGKKKRYTFNKAIDYFDILEVFSTDDSEDEDNENMKSAHIFTQPPVNCHDINSDIDSGYENVADGNVSVLSGNQLLGCSVLEMKLTNGKEESANE